ncbi:MAG: rhomboid family intramembrane serine protease [Bacteroidia bacterium]|nr:rhomboid family intramembrane serine protease [Bacteroidia bacterium]
MNFLPIHAAPIASFIFLITLVTSLYALYVDNRVYQQFILHPYYFFRKKKYYTIITSGLVHAGLLHLILNMITYYFAAFLLEAVFLGSVRFLLLYVLGLIISDIPSLIRYRNRPEYRSLGASGAVSAVIFSFIALNPFQKIYLYIFPAPAWLFGVLYLIYSFFAAKNDPRPINHDAHLWGALTGLILTWIWFPNALFSLI